MSNELELLLPFYGFRAGVHLCGWQDPLLQTNNPPLKSQGFDCSQSKGGRKEEEEEEEEGCHCCCSRWSFFFLLLDFFGSRFLQQQQGAATTNRGETNGAFSKALLPSPPSLPFPLPPFCLCPPRPYQQKEIPAFFFFFLFSAETSPKSAPRTYVPRSWSSRLLKTQLTGERNFARKRNNNFQNGSDFEEFQIARSERDKTKKRQ